MRPQDIRFREAKGREELLELFRLRYDTYRRSRLSGFVPENASGLDIDEYDPWARHFGLFHSGEAVGYIRVVQEDPSPAWEDVVALAQSHGGQSDYSGKRPTVPFPLMAYFPDKMNVKNLYEDFKKQELRICSPGRLVISAEYRGIKVVNFFIECIVAMTMSLKYEITLITCNKSHVNNYLEYGFKRVENIEMHNVNNNMLTLLWGTPFNLITNQLNYFKKLSDDYLNDLELFMKQLKDSVNTIELRDTSRKLLRA